MLGSKIDRVGLLMNEPITIRRAGMEDLDIVQAVLLEAGVEKGNLSEWIESFLLAERTDGSNREVVATVGLEKYGTNGLLRSLVIRKKAWTPDKGLDLLQLILAYSGDNGLEELYLLTESPSLFIHMGFTTVNDGEFPAELMSSLHFRQHRERAVLMRKIL